MVGFSIGFGVGLSRSGIASAAAFGALLVVGCASGAHSFRLNPEQEPEQYRVTCKKRFYYCELEAKAQCDGEYQELGRLSNRPEQTLVKDSDVSSTGPAKGQSHWEGEMTVQCGRLLPPLPLQRPVSEPEPPPPVPLAPPPVASSERVCVPGTTQACLGPGACNGAQACLASGDGFGACDCGPNVNVPVTPSPTSSQAPTSTPDPQ